MKHIKFTIAFALLISNAFAQNELPLSLNEAIETGLKNRFDVQANKFDISIAGNEISKSKKEWMPEIGASGFVRYNPQIQAVYLPPGFGGSTEPSLITLGARNNTVVGLDLNQVIYKPGINNDIKIAKNNLAIAEEKNKDDENAIKEEIAQAYLNVMLKQLQSKITVDDEQRYKDYLEVADGKMKLGTLIENDYLKSKLDYENAKVESKIAKQNLDLAFDNLKYQLNVPAEKEIVLTDSLFSSNLLTAEIQNQNAAGNRTEIKQYMLEQESNALQLQKVKQNALPTVSLFANYSQQFLNEKFNYQLGEWWTPFSYVGIKFSVPITTNFKNANSIDAYKFKSQQTDLYLKQQTAEINFEVQKASAELSNATQNMQTTKSNYELSKTILENQKQQYKIGSLLYSNLLDTDKSLNTAEQNYIRSVYNFLLSKITYQKAIGNF